MESLASAMNFSRIMEERGERIGQEGSAEDRLSDLPKNVIEHIIELLPAPDAARTCALSRNWRYVWADQPSIVLDKQFWFEIMKNKSESSFQIEFINTVNKIILQHITSIQKFVLDISILSSAQFPNVDPWLLHIAYKGLREFTLKNSPRSPYKIPSYLFDCSELTLLSLFNCIIKPPKALVVFYKLKRLFLQHITFHSAVTISTPLLVFLSLQSCHGTNILNISAPLLVSLLLAGNEDLNLSCFMACKNIKHVFLVLCAVDEHHRSVAESINLTELCAAWPMLRAYVI